MSEWQSFSIRDLVGRPISGSRPAGGVDSESEGIPSLGGENVLNDGRMTYINIKRIPCSFLTELDPKKKADKKIITALDKDKEALNARLVRTDAVLKVIGGQISEADARQLILKKIYDIARAELDRYLNAEKRVLVRAVENLWEKYSVSSWELEKARGKTLKELDGFLEGLGYFR